MASDWELLDAFVERRDEGAFGQLAGRHVDSVYGMARRMLGGPRTEAEDVTQAVFLLLARKAGSIRRSGALAGWLFRATRFCCANVRKMAGRRRRHEREAAMTSMELEKVHEDLAGELDAGLATLGEKERQAILVKFLGKKTAVEAGIVLGISAEAVEKRVERGIGKLRGYFGKCGYAVPAATVIAVMGVEAAKAAPVGLSVGLGAGTSGTAAGLAKGAAGMMTWAKVMTAGMVLAAAVMAVGAGIAVVETAGRSGGNVPAVATSGPVSAPSTNAGRTVGAGEHVMFARMDFLLNQAGVDRIKKDLPSVATASKGYEAFMGDAEKLRMGIVSAKGANEVLMMSIAPGWSDMNSGAERVDGENRPDFGLWDSRGFMDSIHIGQPSVSAVIPTMMDQVFSEPRDNAVRLRIEPKAMEVSLWLNNGTPAITKTVEIQYAGDVGLGKAMVLMGNLGQKDEVAYWHVSMWETFACSDEEWRYIERVKATDWVELGVDKKKRAVERALKWNAQAEKLEDVGAKWETHLENGGIVRLVGISDSVRWPDCWWDGDGKAVAGQPWWDIADDTKGLFAEVQVEDPSVTEPSATARQYTAQKNGITGDRKRGTGTTAIINNGRVTMGMGAGPWTDGGEIEMGQTVALGGVKIKLVKTEFVQKKSKTSKGSFSLESENTALPDVETEIVVVDKMGAMVDQNRTPDIWFSRAYATSKEMQSHMDYVERDPRDIGGYRVRWRKRDWTTLQGFATTPMSSPDAMVVKSPVAAPTSAPAPETAAGIAGTPEESMKMVQGWWKRKR